MKKLLFLLGMLTTFSLLYGQDVPKVTNKIFIKDLTLNASPGSSPILGHILIEDGIITNIGASISAPVDARIVKGDSLNAYAGFIATASHIGLKAPKEDNERPKVERTGYPPNDVAGITPEKSIADLYDQKDGSISDFRKQGFVIAHSFPHGKMMPGQGSIISLNGAAFNQAAIAKDHSMYAQWQTSRGVFPSTLIGIMTKWREMYRNAELAKTHTANYNVNPLNLKRPDQDAATGALFPVIDKHQSVYFKSEKHRDIHRALKLQSDLGFNLVLAEVRDVDRILDKVQKSGARILLSLDLPAEEKEEKKEKAEKEEDPSEEKEKKDEDTEDTTAVKEKTKDEIQQEKLSERKKEAVNRYVAQSKILAEKGIPVSYSYLETKAKDVHTNIKRMVKDGLSPADALSALTTNPASTLGIANIAGTLESGKLGNLVITSAPLFDEKSKIKIVIVDGVIHTYDVTEKKKKASDGKEIDVTGAWSYSIEIPGMTTTGTMTFTKNGDAYDAEITNSQNPGTAVSAVGIELDGTNMVFTYSVAAGGMNITLDNDLTFDGDTFEGTISVADFGSFEISGSKETPEK